VWGSSVFALSTNPLALTFSAKVPIQGWNANFNPLLSMPLVDFGTFENVYTAYIPSTATSVADITQSSNFIATLSKGGTGLWNYTLVSGLFSVAPTLVCSMAQAGSGGNASVGAMSTSTFLIETNNSSNTKTDYSHAFTVTRQGADYRDPPQATAAVIKPAVAILSNVLDSSVSGSGGQISTANVWVSSPLNTITGESWFVTLSGTGTTGVAGTNTDFTLDPGTYEMQAAMPFTGYPLIYAYTRFYDVTNSVQAGFSQSDLMGDDANWEGSMLVINHVFTIASATEYRLQGACSTAITALHMGVVGNSDTLDPSPIASQVIIRKLK